MWLPMTFHNFLKKHHGCLAIAAFRNIDFQNFALMVNRPPQIMSLAIDLHEDLVQKSSPVEIV